MLAFIGREEWLQRLKQQLAQTQGNTWRITGQPGIGKSTLLKRFEYECEQSQHPNIRMDMDSLIPNQGANLLADFVASARFFDPEKSNKTLTEKLGENFGTLSNGIAGALKLGQAFIPAGELLAEGAQLIGQLGTNSAEQAANISEHQAAAQPELYLLQALAAPAQKGLKPVLFIDTYEHLLHEGLHMQSQLVFGFGEPREGPSKTIACAEWLGHVFNYLEQQGWRIVLAGRSIPLSQNKDKLPSFSQQEVLDAAKTRPALAPYLDTQAEDITEVLTTLSFGGNPLWLQVAMNLLENLLAKGEDIKQLAKQPDYLQECFATEDPLDIDSYQGIEHGRCKLKLINTLSHHIEGLEDQAWKIALPRKLDMGIIKQLFEPQHANAIVHNFKVAGVFRAEGEQFALHEEIRDLLLAYAESKGWLNTPETRALHAKLWDYLNDFYRAKLPEALQAGFNHRDLEGVIRGDEAVEFNAQLAQHISLHWMAEAIYHYCESLEKLAAPDISPRKLGEALASSPLLTPYEKWQRTTQLPIASAQWIAELLSALSNEIQFLQKVIGESSTTALQQELLSGNAVGLFDIVFWQQRVDRFHLAGDYFGLILVLNEKYLPTHADQLIHLVDEMLARHITSSSEETQVQCAMALDNKGITLRQHLNDPNGAIAAYDQLLSTFAESVHPEVQVQCATALFNKGITLGEHLNDPNGEIAAYDELLSTFAESDHPEIQVQCAKALYSKALTLHSQLHNRAGTIACFDELLTRFAQSTVPGVQAQCRSALADSGELLLASGDTKEAVHRITQCLERTTADDQLFAIMPFLLWLADEAQGTKRVLNAIKQLSPEVAFTWGWDEITPLVAALDEPRKGQAECFIRFFTGEIDLAALEHEL